MKGQTNNLLILSSLFFVATHSFAQERYLRGTVTNSNKISISGASVVIKETRSGTSTDTNGVFVLKTGDEKKLTLIVSSVGYLKKEILIVTENTTNIIIQLDDEAKVLDDLIVTGVFDPRKRIESSVAITTITAAQLEHIVPNSSAELLRLVPGVFVQSARGELRNQIFTRGMVFDGSVYFISIQEDGLPITTGQAGNPSDYLRADVNLSKIEAVRGGSASILGVNAPGGIFNYISKTGGKQFEGIVSTRLGLEGNGKNPYYRIEGNFGGPISKDKSWTYNIGGHYRYANGAKYPGYPLSHGGQLKGNLMKTYNKGFFKLNIKWLNDRSKDFEFTPTVDFDKPRPAGHFTSSSSVLIDGTKLFVPSVGPGIRSLNYDSKDLNHLKDNAISMNWEHRFGDGSWKTNQAFKYSQKSSASIGTFIVYPSDVTSFYYAAIFDLLGKEGKYKFINAASRKDYGTLTQDFSQPNPFAFKGNLPGSEVISNGVFFTPLTYDDTKLNDFFYQGTISKKYKDMRFTVGLYSNKTRYKHYGTQAATGFSTIEDKPQLLAIEYTPNNGGPVQQLTDNNGIGWYGWSPFGVQYNDVKTWDNSLFFGHQWDITPRLNFDWGFRYEWLHLSNYYLTTKSNDTSPDGGVDKNSLTLYDNYVSSLNTPASYNKNAKTFSYSGGLNYRKNKNLAFYARYSLGNKVPDISTYISNQIVGEIIKELPQKIIQLEGGIKYQTDKTALTVTPFLSILSDLPLTGFGQNPGVNGTFYSLPVLYNKVHASGIELEATIQINPEWSVRVNGVIQKFVSDKYQYWDVRDPGPRDDTIIDRSGKKISFFAAPHIFNITPTYRHKKIYAGLNWYNLAKRAVNSNEAFYLPAFSQFDLNIGYAISPKISLKFSVNNLLNHFGIIDWTAPVTDGIFFNTFNTAILTRETVKANPNAIYYTMGIQPRSFFLDLTIKL